MIDIVHTSIWRDLSIYMIAERNLIIFERLILYICRYKYVNIKVKQYIDTKENFIYI